MSSPDHERLDRSNKLEALLGAKAASTLMAHLSPVT
jgi:hypothetical protein